MLWHSSIFHRSSMVRASIFFPTPSCLSSWVDWALIQWDRRKKNLLYKEVAQGLFDQVPPQGVPSFVFFGGTRCRSGLLEETTQRAAWNRYRGMAGSTERQTEEQYLLCTVHPFVCTHPRSRNPDWWPPRRRRKIRYIITDDEFSEPRTLAQLHAISSI